MGRVVRRARTLMSTTTSPTGPSAGRADGARGRVALVLGAGGARGHAHIGVVEELVERGYRIAAIAGSSMGALVGGVYAADRLQAYREWACALERRDVLRLLDFAFGRPGLIKGARVIQAVRELVGEHQVEELALPFVAVATDLRAQREVWITRGPLFDAIRASIAIPMVFTPHAIHGRELVDGGLLAPVPIAATRLFRADLVLAVDVNAQATPPPISAAVNGPRGVPRRARSDAEVGPRDAAEASAPADDGSARERFADFANRLLGRDVDARKVEPAQPGLMQQMSLALDAMQARISQVQLALDPPDVLVRIPHETCFFYEFWRASELIDLGRRATAQALDAFEERRPARR